MSEATDVHPVSVRLPVDLDREVRRRAKSAQRSFSSEIIWVLRQYYDAHPEPKSRKV